MAFSEKITQVIIKYQSHPILFLAPSVKYLCRRGEEATKLVCSFFYFFLLYEKFNNYVVTVSSLICITCDCARELFRIIIEFG